MRQRTCSQDTDTFVDAQGNLIYAFGSAKHGGYHEQQKYFGRINYVTKQWEILSFTGWTSDAQAIPMPLGGASYSPQKFSMYAHPADPNTIFGVFSAGLRAGLSVQDVHSGSYSFKLSGTDLSIGCQITPTIFLAAPR